SRSSPRVRWLWRRSSWSCPHLTLTVIDVEHSVLIDNRRWKVPRSDEYDHRGRGAAARDEGDVLPRSLAPGMDPGRHGRGTPAGAVRPRPEHRAGGGEDRVCVPPHRDRAVGDDVPGP